MFSAPDCGEIGSSPMGVIDVADQMLLTEGFPSFESFNPPPIASMDESASKNQEVSNSSLTSAPLNYTPSTSTGEFDHLIKAEALMTFAPEYGAVETPKSELSSSIFRSPYCPKTRKVESSNSSSNNYTYGALPPSSPCFDGSEKTHSNSKTVPGNYNAKKYYTQVDSGKEHRDTKPVMRNDSHSLTEAIGPSSYSTHNSSNAIKFVQKKQSEGTLGADNILLSIKNVLATEIECIMFQASMCRIRHTLLSSSKTTPTGLSRLSGSSALNQPPGDGSSLTDNLSGRYEVKKKESIPVRIAGDFDGGLLDGPLSAPVGVWRSVGVPKVTKTSSPPSIEVKPSLPHHSFNEEGLLSYRQRQPLQELLDGMGFLVQQATSFVDVALDADCGDGPYGWLALQEHWRRGFSCGPSMVHAGCGGTLASCHSLDSAGVELVDPLSADVSNVSCVFVVC